MSRAYRKPLLILALLLSLGLFASGIAGFGESEHPKSSFANVKPGMTPEQVRRQLGDPPHVARQILYFRYREQWTYDAPHPIRLTFDCPRGEMPQLLTIKGVSDQSEPQP